MAEKIEKLERRQSKRVSCNFSVKIGIAGTNTYGVASNLSAGGCLVEFPEAVNVDTNFVDSRFELPYTLAKIAVKAKIIRKQKNGSRLALEFMSLDDKSARAITQYVRDFKNDQ